MIKIYLTDEQGCYSGFIEQDERAAIPKGAVLVAPPDFLNPSIPIWYDGKWTILPQRPELPDKTIAIKAANWETIKAERDRRTQAGGYQVDGKWFHSDTFSRTQQMALVMMGANIPTGLQWKTMDGSFVTMTQTLANQVFTAGAASDATLFSRAEEIKAIADAAPENFNLADHAWPLNFYG